jgi:acyl carrier protein
VEGEIRAFLAENFVLGADLERLPASASLIETGIIDSTGVLELVAFLEEAYRIRISDAELLPENLDTIDNILHFVGRKRSENEAG